MKKITTLAFLSMAALNINAAEYLDTCKNCNGEVYWIVKDGIINENILQLPYENNDGSLLNSGKTYNGETVAEFLKLNQYNDVRFDLTEAPLNLDKTWVMNIEYAIPAAVDQTSTTYKELTVAGETADGTKPAFIFGLQDSVTTDKGTDVLQARITVQAAIDAIQNGDQFKTRKQFVFANPSIKEMRYFCMSFVRESKEFLEPMYIKNLYFYGEGSKPFYAEDFTTVAATIYSDNTVRLNLAETSEFHGGIIPTPSSGKNITLARCWDKTPDESGLHGSELYHGLSISHEKQDVTTTIDNITIPDGLKSFEVAMLIKKRYLEKKPDHEAAWEEAVANNSIPNLGGFTVKFDNGEEVALYTDKQFPSIWTWEKQTVTVPDGVKTCSLNFTGTDFTYAIDQIRMGDNLVTGIDEAPAEIAAKVVISPNPTSDILTVNTEANKMEVYGLNGVLAIEAAGNQINVSSLAKGIYVVRIYTNDGFITKTFIKE
ncbi:MAG: T9SS type A sorting domain-containing protein [Paludibacteraceae bacterium]|nr:T9SS type A sorting domain-containing protein [Paludibacteraceae bacterium]